ncbi:MAG: branched-chain amino acid ABC transporter permease [Reyranellaceae bacterium]
MQDRLRLGINAALIAVLALLPVYSALFDDVFAMTVMTRVLVHVLAAISLNLILGYGGMVSFGHAMFFGVGGYAVGIMAYHGVTSGFLQYPVAMLGSALLAVAVGALSLRTRAVYFIMITLAFGQMVYFVGVGLEEYGADDGMVLSAATKFGPLSTGNRVQLYYLTFALAMAALYLTWRIVNSRFGMVLQGAKANEPRMQALGFPTYRYKLAAFVIAGALCGLAGALEVDRAEFVSPAMMHWTRSGDFIIMVVLGGMGSLFGPLYGAVAFLVIEEVLSGFTDYWQMIFGPLLVLVVLYARGGIDSLLPGGARSQGGGHG